MARAPHTSIRSTLRCTAAPPGREASEDRQGHQGGPGGYPTDPVLEGQPNRQNRHQGPEDEAGRRGQGCLDRPGPQRFTQPPFIAGVVPLGRRGG